MSRLYVQFMMTGSTETKQKKLKLDEHMYLNRLFVLLGYTFDYDNKCM